MVSVIFLYNTSSPITLYLCPNCVFREEEIASVSSEVDVKEDLLEYPQVRLSYLLLACSLQIRRQYKGLSMRN